MTARRRHIPDRVKLAACLIRIFYITHTQAKTMSVDQILSMAQWDHYPITHADGGPDEPWNLQPLQIRPHLAKTWDRRRHSSEDEADCRHARHAHPEDGRKA